MIDPWKFNPLTVLGNKARTLTEIAYLRECINSYPEICNSVKNIKKQVECGDKKLIENSNELFL